ncbi:DUF397 domain-containing protein [Planosporangium sp. 12N6]|uniref:DUF397 domain-containing protein n=1 Tax=Planosporangium spinosum TaxID=3402278 RepID=UPI003CF84E9E
MSGGRERLVWRRSSRRCGNGACVEVALASTTVHLRDSQDPAGPWLTFSYPEWAAFLRGIRTGDYDEPPVATRDR